MESAVKRKVRTIDASWSTPQLLEAMLHALKGDGPALSTTDLGIEEITSQCALVVTTSGSTGDPKSVLLSAHSLLSNARATHKFLNATSGERWSLLLPTTHIAGLNILIRSIELGTEPVSLSSKADYTAIVPTQLHRALHGDRINVVTTYGMTETTGGVVYNGQPLEGVEIDIREGLIAIKAPQVALGYLHGDFPINDGWFITKDRGELREGKLQVLGRTDDQIISGGEKISL
ncbi:MAG: acyl-CoA synthetase, partial [Actinobacteria bacterium]|nr:acyl-CoA synthetase [Actinomycetota bacterium]